MDGLVPDEALVADLHAESIEEHDRIDRLQRPGLPSGDLFQNSVSNHRDQVRGNVDAIEIVQVPDNLPVAHAPGIHRDDLLVEARKPALVFGDELRVEIRLAVSRDGQVELAAVRRDGLAAIAVAAVSGAVLAGQMMVHLGVQRPFGKRLLQTIKKAARVEGGLWIGA